MDFSTYKKSELVQYAEWYGLKLYMSMTKQQMIDKLEEAITVKTVEQSSESEEIQMSVRIRRIKQQNG